MKKKMKKNKLDTSLDFLARMKVRQTRGSAWLSLLISIGVITANIKLFFEEAGLGTYIIVAVAWVVATTIIGFADEFKGIWKREMDYSTKVINPVFARIDENTKKILKEMREK